MNWDYPVYSEQAQRGEGTNARKLRSALSAEEAYAFVAGDDPRPLLVIRECKVCNGTDRALLSPGADNERTQLLSRWFHCVKLPQDVRDENHPFYELFPKQDAEHLFVASPDGTLRLGLESEGSRTKLWSAMLDVLKSEYKQKPGSALKKIAHSLNELDVVDERRAHLQLRRDEILEEDGPGSRKLKKIAKDLAKLDAKREGLREEIDAATRIELRPRPVEDSREG
jgi:hypothetical protein